MRGVVVIDKVRRVFAGNAFRDEMRLAALILYYPPKLEWRPSNQSKVCWTKDTLVDIGGRKGAAHRGQYIWYGGHTNF